MRRKPEHSSRSRSTSSRWRSPQHEPVHGFELARQLADARESKSLTAHGTLYKALGRLDGLGLLESEWEDPELALEAGPTAPPPLPAHRFGRAPAGSRARRPSLPGVRSREPRDARPPAPHSPGPGSTRSGMPEPVRSGRGSTSSRATSGSTASTPPPRAGARSRLQLAIAGRTRAAQAPTSPGASPTPRASRSRAPRRGLDGVRTLGRVPPPLHRLLGRSGARDLLGGRLGAGRRRASSRGRRPPSSCCSSRVSRCSRGALSSRPG